MRASRGLFETRLERGGGRIRRRGGGWRWSGRSGCEVSGVVGIENGVVLKRRKGGAGAE